MTVKTFNGEAGGTGKPRTFTVFGIYEDTQQRYCETVKACSWQHAEALVREMADEDLLIAGTVQGDVKSVDDKTYGYE